MSTFNIKNPRPLFRRNLRNAPAHPRGDRILVRELPPESVSEGGIEMADKGKERLMAGILMAAGDKAADVLYDGGEEIGDLILYAKYAGVVQEWQHIVGPDDPKCEHDGGRDLVLKPTVLDELRKKDQTAADRKEQAERDRKWALVGGATDNISLRECRACGTLIASERILVMSVDDILANVDLQERVETGALIRHRGATDDGQTQHYIKRLAKRPDCFGSIEPQTKREAA